jgi:glycosyltransferase involved in cell wall biosynthesis
MTHCKIGIVIPNFNKGHQIRECTEGIIETIQNITSDFKILIVDDGSTDLSVSVIRTLTSELGVEAIYLDANSGKGAALRIGIQSLMNNCDVIAYMDADLDLEPKPVLAMIEAIHCGVTDVAIGSKVHPQSVIHYPWSRRFLSKIYSVLARYALGVWIRDTQTGQKAFSAKTAREVVPLTTLDGFAFDAEFLSLAHLRGFRIDEFPVNLDYKFTSSVGFGNGIRALKDLHLIRKITKSKQTLI